MGKGNKGNKLNHILGQICRIFLNVCFRDYLDSIYQISFLQTFYFLKPITLIVTTEYFFICD